MGKQRIHHTLAVAVEFTHLGSGVALGHNGKIDALGNVGFSVQGAFSRHIVTLARLVCRFLGFRQGFAFPDVMIWYAVVAYLLNKNVCGIHRVGHRTHDLAMKVGERNGHIDGLLGHRHIVAGGKGLVDLGGLLGGLPFLEQGRECVDK